MNEISQYWDRSHTEFAFKGKKHSVYAESREGSFPANSSVLDIGGGQGADAEFFLDHGHPVTLIDASSVALQQAQERIKARNFNKEFKAVRAVLGDELLPLPDNSADIVYSRLALHFFDKDKTVEVFKDVYRVLKEGGTAYISVKSPDDIQDNIKEIDFLKNNTQEVSPAVFVDNEGHLRSRFDKSQWEEILNKAGISNFQINTYTEDISNINDVTKSGATKLLLNEIVLRK